jgi:glycerophosphoryl diester phosphodiesterase
MHYRRSSILVPLTVALLMLASCGQDGSILVPGYDNADTMANAVPLSPFQAALLNGVYTVVEGTREFGETLVVKATDSLLSIYSGQNATFFVLHVGHIDSSLVAAGYWRAAQTSATGFTQLFVSPADGAASIMRGDVPPVGMVIRAMVGTASAVPDRFLTLRYERPLRNDAPFWVIAHRGGGRNSDRLPESENSLGIISLAEQFGANAIEIDVRLTKDGVPIVYHDENFSQRLINGEYCIGPVANYSFAQIRTLCTLKNGEPVPTLREALERAYSATHLVLVWLDMKSPEAIVAAKPLVSEFRQRSRNAHRTFDILFGLSSTELVDAYRNQGLTGDTGSVCELTIDDVRATNARAWAPRWTLGPKAAEADALRREGRLTFVWTLDQAEFIRTFLADGHVDGILTNYPSLVAFEYYVSQ